jgi:hypothetical protein
LQQCVVRAINMVIGDKDSCLAVLENNIAMVLDEQDDLDIKGFDAKLDDL